MKLKKDMFEPSSKNHKTKKGYSGYDNPRENIDPDIKTKVLRAKELVLDTIRRTSWLHASEHESTGSDAIDHDSLSGFVANEHIDWTNTSAQLTTTSDIYGRLITAQRDVNGTAAITVKNDIASGAGNTSANSRVSIQSSTSSGNFGAFPSDYSQAWRQDRFSVFSSSDASGLNIEAANSGQDIRFFSGSAGGTPHMTIEDGGNVGIGTSSPATSAKLDIDSTSGALLIPRMSTTQRNALTATNGMIIYNTSTNAFNFRENGSWVTGSGLV